MNHPSMLKNLHQIGNDYDFSLPEQFRHLAMLSLLLLLFAAIAAFFAVPNLAIGLAIVGLVLLLPTFIQLIIVQQTRQLRLNLREQMVIEAKLQGNEHILDIGVGSGITLFGFAKALKTGKGIGIDIYDPNSGGGTSEIFWKNAHKEGIASMVELHNVDARQMPFEDASFDVVVSTFAFHHIAGHGGEGRRKASEEILRVLKPGGKVIVKDVPHALAELETTMRQAGSQIRKEGQRIPLFIAQKPA
jgi:arsenite methyltransferase